MTEAENIDRVVTPAVKVPGKELRSFEIANTIPIMMNWTMPSWQAASSISTWPSPKPKVYGSHTLMAVDSLIRLRGNKGGVISGI